MSIDGLYMLSKAPPNRAAGTVVASKAGRGGGAGTGVDGTNAAALWQTR